MATTKSSTIKRYNGTDYDTINPITIGQNIYGSGTNASTPLLDSSDKINSVFLRNVGGGSGGSSGTPYVDVSTSSQQQDTNTFYDYGGRQYGIVGVGTGGADRTNPTITFGNETSGIVNEYTWQVNADESDVTLTVPSGIKWGRCDGVTVSGTTLTLEAKYTYQFSVINKLGLIFRWANSELDAPTLTFNYPTLSWTSVSGATSYKVYIKKSSNATASGDYKYGKEVTTTTDNCSGTYTQSQLSTPSNVTVSMSSTSAVVSWSPVFNATGYTIYYKKSSASSYSSTTTTNAQSTIISNLTTNTNYDFYIIATYNLLTTLECTVTAMSKTSVDSSGTTSGTYYEYTSSNNSAIVTALTKLATPSLSVSGTTVSWGAISGATSYTVTDATNNNNTTTITGTSIDVKSTWYSDNASGSITVYVTAISSNNTSATASTTVSWSEQQ